MFFHVDESGNTGNNLFDAHQEVLSYGVLCSKLNVDILGRDIHSAMIKKLGVESLHAAELGVARLSEIVPSLLKMQDKFKFGFDYYFIHKPTFALVMFFEAVFDAGLNKAVPWIYYWTPLRFLLLHELSGLLTEDQLKSAWKLVLSAPSKDIEKNIVSLLQGILGDLDAAQMDGRAKEVVSGALQYGILNPLKLDFSVADSRIVSPNAVCFQFVVGAMAKRLRKKKKKDALGIVVDRQSQFNPAQVDTHRFAQKIEMGLAAAPAAERSWYLGHPLHRGFDDVHVLRKNTPKKEIEVRASNDSIGLQIVDIYLWVFNRLLSGKDLSEELLVLVDYLMTTGFIDGISMPFMANRWRQFEASLPKIEEMTPQQIAAAKTITLEHRIKVAGLLDK